MCLKKWQITESALDKTRHGKKILLREEKFEEILVWLLISFWKFLRRLLQETVMSAGAASKAIN
jgi:hypothetical protein